MKLTQTLCKFHPLFVGKIPKFRGQAMAGKHKFVPPATRGTRYALWLSWRDQEEVLKYTSKAYCTADEELDYLESTGRRQHDWDELYTNKIETPMRQRYAMEVLNYFERRRQHDILD